MITYELTTDRPCVCFPVPPQFSGVLDDFASRGFRVLALGYKVMGSDTELGTIERYKESRIT